MRSDKESTDPVERGSIMQISPKAELAAGNGEFAVVVVKHSWGCNVELVSTGAVIPVAWPLMEHTGGKAVWARNGAELPRVPAPPRHHA